MTEYSSMEVDSDTARLLSELDLALDQSGILRDIVSKYERIRSIENITGPSRLTRVMREEIEVLEQKLNSKT